MQLASVALTGAAVAALGGCSGGSGSMPGGSATSAVSSSSGGSLSAQSCGSDCGATMITLTDAAGDFLSYLVNVVSLQLTRSDGTVVEVVPVTTQIDFAQLVNLSEIVSTAEIPAGRYVSAAITLDYAGATIVVDNGTTGVTIAPAAIIDGATSLPLAAPNPTQLTLTLSLGSDQQLVVTPNTVAHLALDFNLLASNTVAPSASNPSTVTVAPVLTASLTPDTTKQLRVRGPLVSVSTIASSYSIAVRPFCSTSGTSGQLTVVTTASTNFTINGTAYTGSTGLAQLSSVAAGTVTAAYGSWNTTTASFTASTVLVGSSVPGASMDSVQGTVIARTADTVTLAGGLLNHAEQAGFSFSPEVSVTVGPSTTVSEIGVSGAFTIQDISVGQHAQFFGTLSGSPGSTTLSAIAGSAELSPTSVVGTVSSAAGNVVTLSLLSLDGRAPTAFSFAGTGTSSATDASAAAYTVALPAALPASGLATGLPARFSGFVTPYGTAPPDFSAESLVNYAQTNALLQVRWSRPGVTMPFATLTGSELLISQASLQGSASDSVRIASVVLNPAASSAGLQIAPDASASNVQYAIGHLQSRRIDSYSTFGDFVTALTAEFNGVNTALQIQALGPYDATSGVLQAEKMLVVTDD
jgi:hypothetical protein